MFSFQPQQQQQQLFDFVGFNVARCVKTEPKVCARPGCPSPLPPLPSPSKSNAQGELKLLSRELAYYLDPDTGSRLTSWVNPFNNVTVDVVHVSNDPVNNPVFGGLPVVQVAGHTQVSQSAHVHDARAHTM